MHAWPELTRRFQPAFTLLLLLHVLSPFALANNAVDVRLVIDISGSVAVNDPEDRRAEALKLLIQTLPEDGYAGIWTFGAQVNRLLPHDRSRALWKQMALTRTAQLKPIALRSNLPEAIRQASWDVDRASTRQRHILVFSDGEVDVADDPQANRAAQNELLQNLVPRLKAAGIRVHGVTFGRHGDGQVLESLARQTGGFAMMGVDPKTLPQRLAATLDSLAAKPTVPTRSASPPQTAAPPHDAARTFVVDGGVSSLDLLWFGAPEQALVLIDPQQRRLRRERLPQGMDWHVGADYELVTMDEPAVGTWRAEATNSAAGVPDARLLVRADVGLRLLDPRGSLSPNGLQSVDVVLQDGTGARIADAELLRRIDVRAFLSNGDERLPVAVDPGPEAGIFRATLTELGELSEGALVFEALAPTFERSVRMPFRVVNPVQLELMPADETTVGWVSVALDGLDHEGLRVTAQVRRAPDPSRWIPLTREPGGLWKMTLGDVSGVHEISLSIRGNYMSGKEFVFSSDPLTATLPVQEAERMRLDESGHRLLGRDPFEIAEAIVADEPEETPVPMDTPVVPEVTPDQRPPELPESELSAASSTVEPMVPVWLSALVSLVTLLLTGGLWFVLRPPALPEHAA